MSTPALKIYNTLTRTKEEFRPIDPAQVRMYVCGPTVYDYAHIGNARPLIVFDVLFRLLRHLAKQGVWDGGKGETKVTYVRNITDVDDKINARAFERGISIRELTDQTIDIFHEDVRALGCLNPTIEPRATDYIRNDDKQIDMVRLIQRLLDSGHAYAADGHVLFDVTSMPSYGRLSRRSLDEMIAGARVDVAPYKRGDMDFVLWKPSKDDEPGWQSPWGRGRPGWHIECSAMSAAHLGETFDIHGGGIDLVFPHHENEIAQSCCAFGRDVMANYWMHNGFLQVEGEKMSKSLGNFVTIHELLNKYHGNIVRLVMLQTDYTQPLDWTLHAAEAARRELLGWTRAIGIEFEDKLPADGEVEEQIIKSLSDDLNTAEALKVLRSLASDNRKGKSSGPLFSALKFLGFRDLDKPGFFESGASTKSPDISPDALLLASKVPVLEANGLALEACSVRSELEKGGHNLEIHADGSAWLSLKDVKQQTERTSQVQQLIAERREARASKNWAESDRIRDELAAMGIILKDHKDGATTWEVKR